jgi:hypothetical protein
MTAELLEALHEIIDARKARIKLILELPPPAATLSYWPSCPSQFADSEARHGNDKEDNSPSGWSQASCSGRMQ